jgi:hypothetical protein
MTPPLVDNHVALRNSPALDCLHYCQPGQPEVKYTLIYYLFICLLFIYLSIHLFIRLFVYLFIRLFIIDERERLTLCRNH